MRLGALLNEEEQKIDVLFAIESIIKKTILESGFANLKIQKVPSKYQPGYQVVYDSKNVKNHMIARIFVQDENDFTVTILSPYANLPIKTEDNVVFQKVIDLHDVGSVTLIRSWLDQQIKDVIAQLRNKMVI